MSAPETRSVRLICRQRLVSSALIILLILAALSGESRELSYSGQTPRDQSVIHPTGPGPSDGRVSLYTGQHAEAFSLVTLPAGALGDVSIGLQYSGNVYQQATLLNDEAQASWVGLGFNLSFGEVVIVCDHKFSVSPADDEYFIIGLGGEPVQLLDSGSFYYPANESKVRAERHTEYVLGKQYVSAWTVWTADSTVYQFGDSVAGCCPTVRSATSYDLHWGDHIGVGMSSGDKLIPTQWHLRRIEKAARTYINYSYLQDVAKVRADIGFYPHDGFSDLSYTRDVYPHKIETSAGYEVEFFASQREDFMSTAGPATVSKFRSVKLDSLVVKYAGAIQSRVQLSYDDLRPQADSTKRKLLLTDITMVGSNAASSLPATSFDYYVDGASSWFGSIRRITYPHGAVKETVYANLESTQVVSELNHRSDRTYAVEPRRALSRDVLLSKFKLEGDDAYRYEIANWNGFWDARLIDGLTSTYGDSAIAAGEGWAVLYDRDISFPGRIPNTGGFVHLKWRGGVWIQELIGTSWEPDRLPARNVNIWAGNDFFIAALTSPDPSGGAQVKSAWFYKKGETGWDEENIFYFGGYSDDALLEEVNLALDIYAITIRNDKDHPDPDEFQLHYGKYSHFEQSLEKTVKGWFDDRILAVAGPNYVAWGLINRFDALWIEDYGETNPVTYDIDLDVGKLERLIGLSDGIAIMSRRFRHNGISWYELIPQCRTYMRTEFPDSDWDELEYNLCQAWDYSSNNLVPVGGNSFIHKEACSGGQKVEYWEWNGLDWTRTELFTGHEDDMVRATENTVVWWSCSSKELKAMRKTGFGEFGPMEELDDNIQYFDPFVICNNPTLTVARDLVVACGDDISYTPERWAFAWNQASSSWDAIDINAYTEQLPNYVTPVAFRGRFFAGVTQGEHSLFQLYRGAFAGKPTITVVDKFLVYPDGDVEGDATVQEFSYAGGILDAGANTPRFVRGTVSTPYFESDAASTLKTFSTSYFFNDLDDDEINEPSLFLPDLEDADTYGLKNGGYALDGISYLSFSDTTNPSDTVYLDTLCWDCYEREPEPPYNCYDWGVAPCPSSIDSSFVIEIPVGKDLDQARQYFSVRLRRQSTSSAPPLPINNPDWRTRTILDSASSQSDLTTNVVRYEYDDYDRIIRTESVVAGDFIRVDSVTYVEWPDSPLAANTELQMSYLWDPATSTIEWLSRDSTEWTSRSRVKRRLSWRDASDDDPANALTSYSLLEDLPGQGVDDFGNVLCWRTVAGDTSSIKYSPDGACQVATIANGFTNNVFVFDAEYDFDAENIGYDGWVNYGGNGDLVTTEALSGERSYELSTMTIDTGLCRSVTPDSLVRSEYFLSFWAKSDELINVVVDTFTTIGVGSCILHQIDATQSIDWNKYELLLELGQHINEGTDSLVIGIGVTHVGGGSGTAYFDNVRFHPVDAVVSTTTYEPLTGLVSSTSGSDNVPILQEYDALRRPHCTRDYNGNLLSEKEYYLSRSGSGTYDPLNPNWVKTTSYSDEHSNVSISYSDGLGRHLQTRRQADFDGSAETLVGGFKTLTGRGQVEKAFKPFVDLVGSKAVDDYSSADSALAEVNEYYDSDGPGADCENYAYHEYKYDGTIESRLDEHMAPGSVMHDHPTEYDYSTYASGSDTAQIVEVTDPDGLVQVSRSDARGRYSSQVTRYYNVDTQANDSVVITSSSWLMQQRDSVVADTGGASIVLRKSYGNDMGLPDSTWKADYGTIRMIYDNVGKIRFMRNDQRLAEDNFVYFKYDEFGRKIEEGVMVDTLGVFFEQDSALERTFPDGNEGDSTAFPTYRWYYDYHTVDSRALLAPGKLVRVENTDSSYYREFHYFPEQLSDSVVVKLPFDSAGVGDLKAIVHKFNRDGTLKELVVYPHLSDTSDARGFAYTYDAAGRLRTLTRQDLVARDSLRYGEFEYTAAGGLARADIGVFGTSFDNLYQRLDYTYDPVGQVTSLADTSDVIAYPVGIGTDSLHFAQELWYNNADSGYYNGRLYKSGYQNSYAYSTKDHRFWYRYNDLGWLTEAYRNNESSDSSSRQYEYNDFGQRTRMIASGLADTIDYVYSSTPGSSRLLSFTGMGIDEMKYDVLGNLVKDSSRGLDTITYDYRNLMNYSFFTSINVDLLHDIYRFTYNESGMRIKKVLNYWYNHSQDPPCDEVQDSTMGDGGFIWGGMMAFGGEIPVEPDPDPDPDPDPVYCPVAHHSEKLYLYDGGVLLATFDAADSVRDMFVNGPTGRLACYHKNDDDKLYFYLNDHLGSARVLVHKTQQTQYYVYYPFGEWIEASISIGTGFQFTGKERDAYGDFAFDYFGARYYDARIGSFTTIDKASQFASGYMYGGNNPLIGVDPDGNLFFLTTAFIMGTIIGGGTYALTTDNFRLEEFLGYALIGGFASYAGAAVAQHSAIASSAVSSSINSAGASMINGDPFSVSLGFATLGPDGFNWSNPTTVSGLLGWMTAAEDLNKVINTGNSFHDVQSKQTKGGGPRQVGVDKDTGEPIMEADIRNADKNAIKRSTVKSSPDSKWRFAQDDGTPLDASELAGVKHAKGDIRFSGVLDGGLHVDPQPKIGNVWHNDYFPSHPIHNPGTAIQHILFESGPADFGRLLGNSLPGSAALYQRVLYTGYYTYRSYYLF